MENKSITKGTTSTIDVFQQFLVTIKDNSSKKRPLGIGFWPARQYNKSVIHQVKMSVLSCFFGEWETGG